MKYIVLFFCLFSILFCSSTDKNDITGIYFSPKNTKLNQLKYGFFVTELKLNLKADSTYIMSSCSQNSNGRWKYKKNKIILICEEIKMANDSLNNLEQFAKGKICGNNEVYDLDNQKLFRIEKIKGKSIKFIYLKINQHSTLLKTGRGNSA